MTSRKPQPKGPKPIHRANYDGAPRPVAIQAVTYAEGHSVPLHMHRRGQLLYAIAGIMRVETADSAWLLSPARALWLPPELPHATTMRGHVDIRALYIDAAHCTELPRQATLMEVSKLL